MQTTERSQSVRARPPSGLAARGKRLWLELNQAATFDPAQRVIAEEACRVADRLERLDAVLQGQEHEFVRVQQADDGELRLVVDGILAESRQQQNVLKQLLVALRLPDEAGKRPQLRSARGGYAGSTGAAAKVSSLDRARQAAGSA